MAAAAAVAPSGWGPRDASTTRAGRLAAALILSLSRGLSCDLLRVQLASVYYSWRLYHQLRYTSQSQQLAATSSGRWSMDATLVLIDFPLPSLCLLVCVTVFQLSVEHGVSDDVDAHSGVVPASPALVLSSPSVLASAVPLSATNSSSASDADRFKAFSGVGHRIDSDSEV